MQFRHDRLDYDFYIIVVFKSRIMRSYFLLAQDEIIWN